MTEPMEVHVRAAAPIAEVRRALTEPDALRGWLAEYTEVELPDRFEFWGRYTPQGDQPRQLLLHSDEDTIRFQWRLDDTDTLVEITVKPEGPDSTIVSLTQTEVPGFADMVAETGNLGLMQTFWALSLANLVDYVEGREITAMCDFTSDQLREQVIIGGEPRAVYDSLMDPEQFAKWFGARIEVEPYVGGRWAMGGFEHDPYPAKILELEPGRKLTMAWDDVEVSWELEESDGKTRLAFMQSGVADPQYGQWMGWVSGIAELRRYHETSHWRPIWIEVHIDGMPEGMLTYQENQ